MPIEHKFLNHDFGRGFFTENSILKNNIYKPEVLFIGTFNHGWSGNRSDFFYGRGMYMWPIMANLFLHNQNLLMKARNFNNDIPTLQEIFEICIKGNLSFADIIAGTKEKVSTIDNGYNVIVNDSYLWNNYKDSHLQSMGRDGLLHDNCLHIINYLQENPSIKNVYFTFKSAGSWIDEKVFFIKEGLPSIKMVPIFTPTGSGFLKNLQIPFDNRPASLAHCWVWNGIDNHVPIEKNGYGYLCHEWLKRSGVDINKF